MISLYPFIKITNEPYPRLLITRQVKRMAVFILVPTLIRELLLKLSDF